MLYDFIRIHRQEVLDRARSKVEARVAPLPTFNELTNGIPHFVDQLTDSLRRALDVGGTTQAIVASAARHGNDLQRMGFTVTQVVHDYGNICQAVTELALEFHTEISTDEFRILNKCLDDAIAGAVTEFGHASDASQENINATHLGELAHELRNKLSAVTLALAAIKSGAVGLAGSTGAVLDRNLRGMRELIDGSLAAVRVETGLQHRQRVAVAELIQEVEADVSLEAVERGVIFGVSHVDVEWHVSADRAILAAAMINLLHNAFKFSRLGGRISLTTTVTADRVLFAVQDECGGLPGGRSEDLFLPFTQRGADRTGVGLGLSISRRGIEADDGELRVKDLPGVGCIFTIDLPRLGPTDTPILPLAA